MFPSAPTTGPCEGNRTNIDSNKIDIRNTVDLENVFPPPMYHGIRRSEELINLWVPCVGEL
jgi:hypothetical protein